MAALAYLDGAFIPEPSAAIGPERLGYFVSPALAESLPIRAGKPLHLAEHMTRLAEGCRALAWPDPDLKKISAVCRSLPKRNHLKEGSLRLRYWGGLDEPLFFAQTLPPRPLPEQVRLMTTAVRHYGPDSLHGRSKASNMLPNWLAKAESEAWAEDGLRLTQDGLVAEGVWSNIVAVKGKVARTPPLHHGILEGVTRAQLLKAMARKGYTVRVQPLTRQDLWVADEVWLTSSLRGALKVASVDGRSLGG